VVGGAPVAPGAVALDGETIVGRHHLSTGYPARNPTGTVNAVVEIPTGTTGKFEVDEADGWLRWALDREDGSRREIDYLAYPVNYGMIPRTLAADGDPLDVLVLGRGIERASVVRTRIIGVLEMAHDGTRDDKLIAVPLDAAWRNGFSRLHELDELDRAYPEARTILALWFSNYWGAGATEVVGWGDAAEANRILDEAMLDVTGPAASTTPPGSADPRPRAASPSGARAGGPRPPHRRSGGA
jgi:inorganic pyrophosphatase